jgi:hypothetical protein
VLLWAPALLYDLRGYATEPGQAASLISVPLLYAVVVAVAFVVAVFLARSRYRWLAAATAAVLSLPRLFVYDVTFIMLGVLPRSVPELPEPDQQQAQ